MCVMLLIFSAPATTLPAAQHSTLQYEANGNVDQKSIFLTCGKNICYCDIYNGLYLHSSLSTRNKINIHTALTRARTLSSEVNQIYVTYLSNWAGYRRPAAALLRVVAKINLLPASLFRLGSPESSTHNSHLNLADKWTSLPFSFSVLPSPVAGGEGGVGSLFCVALDSRY